MAKLMLWNANNSVEEGYSRNPVNHWTFCPRVLLCQRAIRCSVCGSRCVFAFIAVGKGTFTVSVGKE